MLPLPSTSSQNESCPHTSTKGLEGSATWQSLPLPVRGLSPFSLETGSINYYRKWLSKQSQVKIYSWLSPAPRSHPPRASFLLYRLTLASLSEEEVLASVLLLAWSRDFATGKFHGGQEPAENIRRGKSGPEA